MHTHESKKIGEYVLKGLRYPVNRCERQSIAINRFFSSLVDSDDDNHSLIWILFLYIPGYIWQWLPAALWLLLYVLFKALFPRGAGSENSLYSNDSLISCFLAFVVFTTEMCVQILIKRWASLCCLLPLTVPLDWTPANQAIYFPLPSFSFPCENQFKDFLVCCYKSLLISVLIWEVACNGRCWAGNTVFPALCVPWNIGFLQNVWVLCFCRSERYKLRTGVTIKYYWLF